MNDYLSRVFKQIADFIKALSPARRLAMLLTGAAISVALVVLFIWAGNTNYVPLMNNLSAEDSANVIRILREKRIPFKVDPTGRNVSIPPESVYDLRLELATLGMPQSSVVGYEVFDKQSLGTTSFVQKLNEKRALEGELTRTVNTIKGVKRSRVHLAIPQKSAFVEDQKKPSASVVVDLEPGTVLGDKQVWGVGNLVARSVPGMDISDVVIVDSQGKVLSKNNSDPTAAANATHLDFQRKIEGDIERRIEEMLSRVVGEGRVVAKVSADVDFSSTSETQTIYDGDAAVPKVVQKDSNAASGTRPAPGGVAGAQSNTASNVADKIGNEIKTETNKNNENVTYEIPSTIRRLQKPSGQIKKLSVAVVVDGKVVKTTGKDGIVQAKSEPWPQEKLEEFKTVVASAAGIDLKRGDTLDIKHMDFTHEDFDEIEKRITEQQKREYIRNLIILATIGTVILLFFFLVVRPFIKWVTENTTDSVDTFLPQTIEELERLQKNAALPGLEETVPILPEKIDPEKVEGDMLKEKIISMVEANPHKAALILKDWLEGKTQLVDSEKGKEKSG